MEPFTFLSQLRGVNGDGPDGEWHPASELNALMTLHPVWGEEHRSFIEHTWRDANRQASLGWFRLLIDCARYLSDLLGTDVPVLVPRDVAEASVGIRRATDDTALLLGKTVQRSIASQVAHNVAITNEALLEEIRTLFAARRTEPAPSSSRWLSTRDIAVRLSIDEVTAARLCKRGLIHADKTAGGQWRTTEERLRQSPYLKGQNRRRRRSRNNGHGAVE